MPTAYLSPSLLQDLTNVSVSPGAGNTGYPLVWNNTSGRFELAVLGVAGGGTGTSDGSITGTGALTFAAGGTNNLNLVVPKQARVQIGSSPTEGSFLAVGPVNVGYNPADLGTASYGGIGAKGYSGGIFYMQDGTNNGGQFFYDANGLSFSNITDTTPSILRFNSGDARQSWQPDAIQIKTNNSVEFGRGVVVVLNATESTSTTTGACIISGGLGVAKNVNIGGNLRFAGGTVPATATSAGTTGDIRYDGSHLYICTATNTWRRTALSTW